MRSVIAAEFYYLLFYGAAVDSPLRIAVMIVQVHGTGRWQQGDFSVAEHRCAHLRLEKSALLKFN